MRGACPFIDACRSSAHRPSIELIVSRHFDLVVSGLGTHTSVPPDNTNGHPLFSSHRGEFSKNSHEGAHEGVSIGFRVN